MASPASKAASPSPPRNSSPEGSPRGKHVENLRDGSYLVRIPVVKQSGDELKDEEQQAAMDSLAQMVHSLISNPRHVGPLNSQLQKRLLTESQQVAQEEDSKFNMAEVTLKGIPSDWAIVYITTISDLTHADITNANGVNEGSWLQLLQHETQLAAVQKNPPACVIKDVLKRTLDFLSQHHGSRLSNWKSAGGILPSGAINWKKGSWQPIWETVTEQGKLAGVLHVKTDVQHAPDLDYMQRIDKAWGLTTNWLDDKAAFSLNKFPAIPVVKVLRQDTTFKAQTPAQKTMQLLELATTSQQNYEAAKLACVSGDFNTATLSACNDATQQQRKRNMEGGIASLKEKAKARLEQRREASVLSFDEDTPPVSDGTTSGAGAGAGAIASGLNVVQEAPGQTDGDAVVVPDAVQGGEAVQQGGDKGKGKGKDKGSKGKKGKDAVLP